MLSNRISRERGLFIGWTASVLAICVLLRYLYVQGY